MTAYIIQRFAQTLVVLVVMSILVFAGVYAIGNPVDLLVDPNLGQEARDRAIEELGLNRPLWEQYFVYLGNLVQGDLGRSFVYNEQAFQVILERLPATFELALSALAIGIILGIPLGVIAGYQAQTTMSRTIISGSILGFSMPSFWVGIMLIMCFGVILGWLPAGGRGQTIEVLGMPVSFLTLDGIRHLILPAMNLGIFVAAMVIRVTAACTQEVAAQEYIKFARVKGLRPREILTIHIMRNVLIPVITVVGIEFGNLLAFSVVTENVFAWPGMGKLLVDSIGMLDRPIIVGYLLIVVLVFVFINLLVDVFYAIIDPRVRLSGQKA
jgi:peptide/nickel transport system permease protein